MIDEELEPLPTDVLSLLAKAKAIPALAPSHKASLLAAIDARIVPPGGGGSGGGSSDGGLGSIAKTKLAAVILATFGAGVVAGVGIDRASAPPPSPAASVVAIAAPSAPPPILSVEPRVEAISATSLPDAPRVHASASAAHETTPIPSSRGLAAERALLDVARSALARGEASDALAAATRHAREYPDGALVEEREAIAIRALVALGRRDEARTRADQLERRFPNGLAIRAVRAALEENH